ncbi:MAG: 3'(2'),5'-bisphosphate nucleotidase CysQ [Cyclobacteriaceae bacterium]
MIDYEFLIERAKSVALDAGKAILDVYNSADFGAELKTDNSPLTLADKAAHDVIVKGLKDADLPILSEEGRSIDYSERKSWEYFWMVDPLDGTKEFIKKNGEFTVNIALIKGNEAIAGVVYAPVLDWLYWSIPGNGAFKKAGKEETKPITASPFDASKQGIKVVASRSHLNEETQSYIDTFVDPELVSMGSSLKILLVGEGAADVYPRYAPTMEWDTAAAHAVIKNAGANVYQKRGNIEVGYNKEDLLNPHFLVRGQ